MHQTSVLCFGYCAGAQPKCERLAAAALQISVVNAVDRPDEEQAIDRNLIDQKRSLYLVLWRWVGLRALFVRDAACLTGVIPRTPCSPADLMRDCTAMERKECQRSLESYSQSRMRRWDEGAEKQSLWCCSCSWKVRSARFRLRPDRCSHEPAGIARRHSKAECMFLWCRVG